MILSVAQDCTGGAFVKKCVKKCVRRTLRSLSRDRLVKMGNTGPLSLSIHAMGLSRPTRVAACALSLALGPLGQDRPG